MHTSSWREKRGLVELGSANCGVHVKAHKSPWNISQPGVEGAKGSPGLPTSLGFHVQEENSEESPES